MIASHRPPTIMPRLLLGFAAMTFFGAAPTRADSPALPTNQESPPPTITPGNGLDISSPDGAFRLTTRVFGQMLYSLSHDHELEDWRQGFEVRRARLIFAGHVYGAHNQYFIQLAFSPRDLKFENGMPTQTPIFDWYFRFDHFRDLTLQVGQYRVPFSKQRRIPIAKLQFIDRTVGNFEFNLDRDIGLDIRSADLFGWDHLRYHVGLFIGKGRDNYGSADLGLLYSGRIELLPFGIFDDYREADLNPVRTPRLALGVAYAFVDNAKYDRGIGGDIPADGGTTDTHNFTADAMLKIAGISLFSEFYWRRGHRRYGSRISQGPDGEFAYIQEAPRDGIGWWSQVGWTLCPAVLGTGRVELAGRFGQVHPTGQQTSLVRQDEMGLGVNWYVHGSAMALAADFHRRYFDGDFGAGTDEFRVRLQAGF